MRRESVWRMSGPLPALSAVLASVRACSSGITSTFTMMLSYFARNDAKLSSGMKFSRPNQTVSSTGSSSPAAASLPPVANTTEPVIAKLTIRLQIRILRIFSMIPASSIDNGDSHDGPAGVRTQVSSVPDWYRRIGTEVPTAADYPSHPRDFARRMR